MFDDYLALLEGGGLTPIDGSDPIFLRIEDATRRLRALLETWTWSRQAPEPIVQVAREWLAAYRLPEPAEGWDQWTGPDDEGERPRP